MATQLWQQQADLVRRAIADAAPVAHADLLLPSDLAGRPTRAMQPPGGTVPREAAALLLLYPHEGELWLPLTERSSRLRHHRGQISLPGGATEPTDAGPIDTALREAQEEVGVDPATVEVLGLLTPFYIPPSNFRLTPVVGLSVVPPTFHHDPLEVEAVFSVSLRQLLDPATVAVEEWQLRDVPMNVPFFALNGYKVWGATAILLSEFVARVRRVAV